MHSTFEFLGCRSARPFRFLGCVHCVRSYVRYYYECILLSNEHNILILIYYSLNFCFILFYLFMFFMCFPKSSSYNIEKYVHKRIVTDEFENTTCFDMSLHTQA